MVAAVFLGHDLFGDSSWVRRSGLASGLSILFIATTSGTPAPGVVDGFVRLRHHAVVSSDNQDDDVGRLGAAQRHRREGFVTGRIEKSERRRGRFLT